MDVSTLTKEETELILQQATLRLEQLRIEERDRQDNRTARISAAIGQLDALLGPADAPPGTGSIRAVRGFDGQTMADNAAIALPLAFHGLEILTTVVRDMAAIIAAKQ